jgi:hypothetical protein
MKTSIALTKGATPMGESGNDIIIKGGTVELEFKDDVYRKVSGDPTKYRNANKKITRVVITGDISYDSQDHPNGLKCEITATCK